MTARRPHVRLRTASERRKALAQLTELRSKGVVAKALIIIERKDGDFEVLGQEMRPYEINRALYAAAAAIEHAEAERLGHQLEPLEAALAWGEEAGPRRAPEITRDAEGILVPPAGETIISCAECRHPRWYVLVSESGEGPPVRLACGHCGNEVKMLRVTHREGRA